MHPLLLEPSYWRSRLEVQHATRPFLLITPRSDLSTAGCEVQELRFQAHDGVRLWGLMGRCPLLRSEQPARVSFVSACQPVSIDVETVQQGRTEFVVQMPVGRRLEDRVLDGLRLIALASNFENVDSARVRFSGQGDPDAPDEVLIIDKLRVDGFL